MAMWHMRYGDITPLAKRLNDLPLFYKASDYVNRDKSSDTDGYLLHISGDTDDTVREQTDLYYHDFYHALLPKSTENAPVLLTETETATRISDLLRETTSDKESDAAHRYGQLYDLIFDAVAKRQGNRKLRVCEIGVSFFGEGSLKAFQQSGIVAEVVGVDLLDYGGNWHPTPLSTRLTMPMHTRRYGFSKNTTSRLTSSLTTGHTIRQIRSSLSGIMSNCWHREAR